MKIYVWLFLMFCSLSGFAQSIITPVSNSVEKKWIRNGVTEMTCFTKSGNQWTPFGSFEISIQQSNSRLQVSTALSLNNSEKRWLDTSISEIGSFKPVYRSSFTPDRNMVLRFDKEVNGYYYDKTNNKQLVVQEKLNGNFFESYTYPYLLAALPLAPGFKGEMAVYDYKPGVKMNAKKALIEEVKSNVYRSELTGEHKVWQVSVLEEATGDKYDYYIDKESRRLWKIEVFSKNQHILMIDRENDYNPFTTSLDKERALAMIKSGNSVIAGEAFARDNENEGLLGGKAVLNINKKQFAPKGTAILLIPYTPYFKEWVKINEASRKKGKAIPLSKDAAACIKVAAVYDDKGSFEFVNLMPGEYLLYTEFGYVHTSVRNEIVGYTDTYINGMFQGSSANTEVRRYGSNAMAGIKKVIEVKSDGDKVTVKLKKTL